MIISLKKSTKSNFKFLDPKTGLLSCANCHVKIVDDQDYSHYNGWSNFSNTEHAHKTFKYLSQRKVQHLYLCRNCWNKIENEVFDNYTNLNEKMLDKLYDIVVKLI